MTGEATLMICKIIIMMQRSSSKLKGMHSFSHLIHTHTLSLSLSNANTYFSIFFNSKEERRGVTSQAVVRVTHRRSATVAYFHASDLISLEEKLALFVRGL